MTVRGDSFYEQRHAAQSIRIVNYRRALRQLQKAHAGVKAYGDAGWARYRAEYERASRLDASLRLSKANPQPLRVTRMERWRYEAYAIASLLGALTTVLVVVLGGFLLLRVLWRFV